MTWIAGKPATAVQPIYASDQCEIDLARRELRVHRIPPRLSAARPLVRPAQGGSTAARRPVTRAHHRRERGHQSARAPHVSGRPCGCHAAGARPYLCLWRGDAHRTRRHQQDHPCTEQLAEKLAGLEKEKSSAANEPRRSGTLPSCCGRRASTCPCTARQPLMRSRGTFAARPTTQRQNTLSQALRAAVSLACPLVGPGSAKAHVRFARRSTIGSSKASPPTTCLL